MRLIWRSGTFVTFGVISLSCTSRRLDLSCPRKTIKCGNHWQVNPWLPLYFSTGVEAWLRCFGIERKWADFWVTACSLRHCDLFLFIGSLAGLAVCGIELLAVARLWLLLRLRLWSAPWKPAGPFLPIGSTKSIAPAANCSLICAFALPIA